MFKKKFLAFASAALLVIPVFSFSASAANGDKIKVGGKEVKIVTDYEHFNDGLRVGQNGDEVFIAGDNTDDKKINCHVKDGAGVDGSKGLVFGVQPKIDGKGVFFGTSYKVAKDKNSVFDLQGATDFVFWVDCTKEPDENVTMQIVFGEWDHDKNGKPVMVKDPNTDQPINQITWRNLYDGVDTYYYTLEDGKWVEHKGTSGCYLRLSNKFKGYVRIPLDTFELCWGSKDNNEAFDFKHLVSIDFYTGLYPRHVKAGQAFTVDNVGFAGKFKETQKPTDGSKDIKDDGKTTDDTNNTDQNNPKTGEMPITAALATGIVFAGIAFATRKRTK